MCPRAPHKNDHVLKMMKKNLVELRPVLLLPKANFSLRQTCRNISVASAACAGDHSVITVADHSAADHSVIIVYVNFTHGLGAPTRMSTPGAPTSLIRPWF